MLGLHEEFLEIEWPYAEECVSATGDAESIVYCDREYFMIVGFVSSLQSFILVVYLENHSVFASDEYPLQSFIFISIGRFEAILKVKAREDSFSGVMVKNNGRSSNITCVSNPPESNVLLTARSQSRSVNWAEFEGKNVEF